jgi:hypothetical protein
MRQIKTLFIAAIFILGASQTINAQTKTAHVDVSDYDKNASNVRCSKTIG